MGTLKNAMIGTVLVSSFASMPLMAYETGDFVARVGWAHLAPNDDADDFSGLPGTTVSVEDSDTLGVSFTYMFTDNLGVGLLGVWPFTVDIKGDKGALAGTGKVADTKALPPTVTLQYHFNSGSNLHPYVGAGINYTYFWDENTNGALSGTQLDLDDSFGLAAEAGLDYDIGNGTLISAQVWYARIGTTADSSAAGKADVDIDPWVFMLGVGKKF
ncbi:outer membrane protein [Thiogranum longum]|uniref:Outer membrane protein n=1 Tax=Thiogranum longum TaxID=1537524 RepID=A0A4V2PH69_9GAMM|nr:OmpW family outer membrane protein [Thiogranum longum]TCK19566.1 outer membrane protein [Thiogranum longum]